MTQPSNKKAVLYCRVSSQKQTTRGDGLSSQETRCREYARYKGYEVAQVFKDDMSGSLINRPGMQAMLGYLRKYKRESHVVIIDDISRLARGLKAHLQLRSAIGKAGAVLESPSIEFGEDSDSVLVENLLASVSQHQRQKNSEQTKNRMRARIQNGYWVFQAPVGYRYQRVSGQGNVLVRDEPLASIIQEALEGYASGRFQLQAEVKRFLESHLEFPRDRNGDVRNQRVTDLLTSCVYAGYVEAPNWEVGLRPGHHEGLISFETFRKIENRLKAGARVPARKNLNADFPLRGFVTCGHCGTPLTACWSQGRTGRYPYYLCPTKGCTS
ncbi:MAG: recombinase family protein [Methylococcaceae bacterium]|nr:recombinase family protein [Methylococcaceae bacterium]